MWRKVRVFLLLALVACLGYFLHAWMYPPVPAFQTYALFDGLMIHVNPGDSVITAGKIEGGYWEPVLTKFLLASLREGDTLIDIGANIGYYTMLGAKKVGPRGRVIAFEPEPRAFSFLKRNAEVNRFINITAEQKALSNAPGTLKLYIARENLGDHRIFVAEDARQVVEVQAVALDDYLADDTPVHVIKIDTQGAEA